MKLLPAVLMIIILMSACSKSSTNSDVTNVLIGKWSLQLITEQYVNPYSQVVEYDTVSHGSVTAEFRMDGKYYENETLLCTYELVTDSSYILKPVGLENMNFIFSVSGNKLKTKRPGNSFRQILIYNPDLPGEYKVVDIQFTLNEYVKQ